MSPPWAGDVSEAVVPWPDLDVYLSRCVPEVGQMGGWHHEEP